VADQTRELSVLYEVSAIASQAQNLETLLARSLERLLAAIHCEIGAIYLLDEAKDRPTLRLAVQQGISADLLPQLELLPADTGVTGWVMMQGEPLLAPNLIAPTFTSGKAQPTEPMTCIVAPLRAGGQVIGILGLLREPGRTFKVEEIALLGSIADQVGGAVESERLRQLSKQTAILAERQCMARELHDSVTQSLYSLSLLAELGQAQLDTGDRTAANLTFSRISETTRQALKEMRLFIHRLRPPILEQEGLVGALHQRLAAVEGRADVQARLLADDLPDLPLPIAEALYYIAQEALNNTLNHAHAASVSVHLHLKGEQLILEVTDSGRGFDLAINRGGLGLTHMRERAEQLGGSIEINSMPGLGTTIRVKLNLMIKSDAL
jgi:signal transduction histidine kinase